MTTDREPRIAPFALVRLAALAHPAPPAAAAAFRSAVNSLVRLESTVAELALQLPDALYASADGHSAEFHRRVVLPLRRDVHNGRTPKPVDLGTLPERVPLLAQWLSAGSALAGAQAAVAEQWPAALAAERAVLAELAAAEPLRRAVVLTGPDLVHGLDRAARGELDRKARKAEATVLRYALRATSKTSPFSWYTYVGWGRWSTDDELAFQAPVAHAQLNQVLLARLVESLSRTHRDALPHRLAPAVRERDGKIVFQRDVPVEGAKRAYLTNSETVAITATGPLRFLLAVAHGKGATPAELASALATKLPDEHAPAAAKYVTRLLDIGLLIPVRPVDPHDPDAALALAQWLRDREQTDVANRLTALVFRTTSFAGLDVRGRQARMSELEATWRELGPDLTGVPPVAEDVVLPGVARLGPAHGQAATGTLARLTPLLMAFDRQLLIRRIARDRFVTRFGAGGAAHPADCAELLGAALIESLAGPASEAGEEIHAVRARLAGMLDAAAADREIPDEMVRSAAESLPQWTRTRPVSYSWFVQPLPAGGLVVNHCYAGFARFTSRFLDRLPPAARSDVTGYLDEVLPAGFTQYRPVGGFTANLHPMLGAEEIGEDLRWADLTPDDIEVRHSPANDDLQLVHKASGRRLDVLYLGFLMPLMLPDRVSALYTDMSCGWVDLDGLRSSVNRGDVVEQGRLRYRDVVLARRSWDFGGQAANRLRTDFTGDVSAALAAARLRAQHDLPEHVFIGAGGGITSMADFEQRLSAPKPQYVDLASALHTRCVQRVFNRHNTDVRLTEALPVPAGRVVELIAETWWRAS
ncbi:MAG: lantibiotic dehydratase [Kibdelosporangium sp.]